MRNDGPGLPQQRDIAIVDIPAVRRKQTRAKEAGLVEKRSGRIPWCRTMKSTSATLCDK